ncbi:MAG: hypothetical protein WC823_01595 [Parcubacteria group bacterium]|jgi:hypothetical protein
MAVKEVFLVGLNSIIQLGIIEKKIVEWRYIMLGFKIVGMDYQKSDSRITTGIKQGERIPGKRVFAGSNGTYVVGDGAHIVVVVEKDGKKISVEIERQVKESMCIERISKKIFENLKNTQPDYIDLEEHTKLSGEKYYKITDSCCDAWTQRL